MGLLKGFAIFASGILLVIIGYGMYRSPELDWEGFTNTILHIGEGIIAEINRFVADPFALLGVFVILIGMGLILYGGKKMIERSKTPNL